MGGESGESTNEPMNASCSIRYSISGFVVFLKSKLWPTIRNILTEEKAKTNKKTNKMIDLYLSTL